MKDSEKRLTAQKAASTTLELIIILGCIYWVLNETSPESVVALLGILLSYLKRQK